MKVSALFNRPAPRPQPRPTPPQLKRTAVDSFEAARPAPLRLLPDAPVIPGVASGATVTAALLRSSFAAGPAALAGAGPVASPAAMTAAPSSAGAVGDAPVLSPYYLGRIHRDGRAMVGENGQAFTYRGVSEFLLPKYLNDKSRTPEENERLVGERMNERAQQGYSVMRVFGAVSWDSAPLKPFDDWNAYKQNTEKLFSMAKDRGMYIEFTAFTDAELTIPPVKRGEYIDFVAQMAAKYDNAFVEICNESFKNGLSEQQVYDLGKRFKQTAPNAMLAGSSPTGDGIDGSAGDGAEFGRPPFDYVTLHSERADGDDGFRWVRHMREGESVSGTTGLPVVQDEPMGSAGSTVPGRRDSDPQHFRDAALVAAVTNQGFTFHTERAVTPDPNAQVPEPGADLTRISDLIPADPRGTHFVNGHWPDSPFDVGNQFETNVLRVFTKMKDDGSGFWTYPVEVKNDLDLKLKSATHLTVMDVASGEKIIDRDFASGEVLRLPKGSDVVIAGGSAALGEPKVPGADQPAPEQMGSPDPLPSQRLAGAIRTAPCSADEAKGIVERLYRGLLGREPDADGLAGWIPQVAAGGLRAVVNAFVSSPEFAARQASLTVGGVATDLYRAILGRNPDPDGLAGTEANLRAGQLSERTVQMLLSDEYRSGPRPSMPEPTPPKPGPVEPPPVTPPARPPEPGQALSTVPFRPEYLGATIDKSSVSSAVKSAAAWAKQNYPELFAKADDRQTCFEIMGRVIGALRAAGYDAHRVVNHPDRPVGDGWRYGSDALVLDGRVYDVFVAMGAATTPAANDVGEYASGRLRE